MENAKKFKRRMEGTVVSTKNENTIVVSTTRQFKHSKYSKFVKETKKYHAHDASSLAKTGDKVMIIESKPFSKLKKWELVKVLS